MVTAKIGIDAGHGGKDRANRGPTGYVEADGVLHISKVVRDELKKQGCQVIMTREKDQTLKISDRARIFNRAGVDVGVSIHTNAAASSKVRGVETIHSIHGGRGKRLAEIIAQRLHSDLCVPLRRVFSRESRVNPGKDYYGIIRGTFMPCVIVEVEFHSNPEAERLLKDIAFRERAGKSIAKGIMEFLEVV